MLRLEGVSSSYGSAEVLKGISLEVDEGEFVCVLGANGAGKTTLLRTISGLMRHRRGSITFLGKDISGAGSDAVVKMGIVHVPEGRQIFPDMTVIENLEMGAYSRRDRQGITEDLERVFTLFPRLRERHKQTGGSMSGGEQQMLAIGRGLMARPKVFLLDEPSLGLAPLVVEHIYDVIFDIHKQGTTILLVEQNAPLALDVANRGYILASGRILHSGSAAELAADEAVQRAYLGV
ncbi:MAG: ABC transporter ATP-binding protein [Chloroflexota bacterium]|nr:MAG: ABC transporter ATP-binding protein [Chloroflexota bacterium]